MHQHELKFTLVGLACPLLPYYPPFTDTYSSARHQPRQGCRNGCRNVTRLSRSRHRGGQVHVIRWHPRSQIEDQTPAQAATNAVAAGTRRVPNHEGNRFPHKKKGFTIQAISCLFGAQQYLLWQLGPATQKLLRICKILTLTDLLLYRFNFKKSLPHSKRRQRIKRSFQIRIIGVNGAQACKLIGAFGVEP